MNYDFCLDDLKVRDYLVLSNLQFYGMLGVAFPPNILQDLLEMAAQYTNIDPMELPIDELMPFVEQFMQALDLYWKERH